MLPIREYKVNNKKWVIVLFVCVVGVRVGVHVCAMGGNVCA